MSRKRRTAAAPLVPAQGPSPQTQDPARESPGARSSTGFPWLALALIVGAVSVSWWGTGALARRAQSASIPALEDLSNLPPPARAQVEAADAAARAHPRDARSVGALGTAYHASLLPLAAIDVYAIADHLDPGGWEWIYRKGLLLEERGRQAEGMDAFNRVTAVNPSHGMTWFRLGEIAFKEGRLADAERAYVRAEQAPETPAFTAPGVPARQTTPLTAYAQFGRVRVALDSGRREAAMAGLDRIIAAYPAFGPARTMKVQLTSEAGIADTLAARAYTPPADPLLDAVVAQSRMRDLLLKHAALAERGGDRAWREFLVRRALEYNPRDPNVLMEMAGMLQSSGRLTEALDYLRQHKTIVPGDHHTLVEEGRVLSDLGRFAEAEAVLRDATRVRDAAAHYNLGVVLDRTGRTDAARSHYEAALEIDPYHARAMNNLGVWLDRHGQSDAAIALLRRSIHAAPENAETHSNLGSALIGARRLPEAVRALELAIALGPEAPDAHNNLGIALAQSGRLAEAQREFTAALKLNPNHANARRNLESITAPPR